jgi:type III secretion protein U
MSSEKTEQPTPHKIRKAREDGQVAKSKDFTQTLLMGALLGYTLADSERLLGQMTKIMLMPAQLHGVEFRTAVALALSGMVADGVLLLLPYVLIILIVAVFAEAIQTGLLISFKVLIPKGERLNVQER